MSNHRMTETKNRSQASPKNITTFQNAPTDCGIFRNGDGGVYLSSVKWLMDGVS